MQITNNSALQVLITASDETHPVLQKAKEDLLSYYNAIFSPIQNPQESILVRFAVQSDSELRFDGFAVDVKSSEIIITSPMERGILYGVYALLKQLGCYFIFPQKEQEVVPNHKSFCLQEARAVFNPLMEYRGMCLYQTMRSTLKETLDAVDYMAKNYYNLLLTSMDREDDTTGDCHAILYCEIEKELLPALQARGIDIDMSEHSTDYFFPRKKLFKQHPQWFSLINGKRIPGQICYANEDAVNEYIKAFVDFAQQHDEFAFLGTWPLDGGGYCQCKKCKDPLLLLKVNQKIAAAVHKVRPNLVLEHLAYTPQSFTRPPYALPENLSVLVCSVKDQVAYEWGQCAEHGGGAFYFDYCTGDHYRYRANLMINPFYIQTMVNTFATYRYRGIISLVLPITAWWQAGINYSLLSQSYYNPLEPVETQIQTLCKGIFGQANHMLMAQALYKTVSELQSKLLWSGHPHKHTYMPQHTDFRTKAVDDMHLLRFEEIYTEISELLQKVDVKAFTLQQMQHYQYFQAYLALQKIYFTDIDQFDATQQTEAKAERYLATLREYEATFGRVFISEQYARWRIIGRDNILQKSDANNAYQPQTE